MATEQDLARARSQARAQFDCIREMVERLSRAQAGESAPEAYDKAARDAGWRRAESGEWHRTAKADETPDPDTLSSTGKRMVWAQSASTACEVDGIEAEPEDEDEARRAIEENALSVQVRSGWYSPGTPREEVAAEEYEILLCTGGPAVRMIGKLGAHGEPESATMQYQDWFIPWTDWTGDDVPDDADEIMLAYALAFYFGEG